MLIPDIAISTDEFAALRAAPTAIARNDAVLRVEGPGAEACLQGVLTNDVVRDARPLVWGAVLTPKGMIITDLWVRRTAQAFWLVVPRAGHQALLGVLARSFPPRLAKVTDLTDEMAAWWLVGDNLAGVDGADIATTTDPAPFDALALTERSGSDARFERAGWRPATTTLGDALAVLRGWPAVGREIDEKTLPQEVRFDELQGVKYDKGCYVGQETVARLHFRGHANRTLRAMSGQGPQPDDRTIANADGKVVGVVATLLTVGPAWVATAKVRREVATGDVVIVGGRSTTVTEYPVELDGPIGA